MEPLVSNLRKKVLNVKNKPIPDILIQSQKMLKFTGLHPSNNDIWSKVRSFAGLSMGVFVFVLIIIDLLICRDNIQIFAKRMEGFISMIQVQKYL